MILNVLEPRFGDEVIAKALADMKAGLLVEPMRRLIELKNQKRMFAPIDPLPSLDLGKVQFQWLTEQLDNNPDVKVRVLNSEQQIDPLPMWKQFKFTPVDEHRSGRKPKRVNL